MAVEGEAVGLETESEMKREVAGPVESLMSEFVLESGRGRERVECFFANRLLALFWPL